MTHRILLALALTAASLAPAAAQPVDLLDPQSVAEQARPPRPRPPVGFPVLPGVYRLDGSDPSLPQADLEPLRQIIGNAPVVALGESIHTSGGYYEMKHRVFRFLVEKMGFRVFAFESPWTGAEQVSQYVQTCAGSPEEALRGLFGVWESAETRELVRWMCEWNRAHPRPRDKVHFFGFDMQQPEDDGPRLLAFLERIGIGPGDPRAVNIRRCDGVDDLRSAGLVSAEQHEACHAGLQAIDELFRRDARTITRQTSKWDFEWAKINLVALRAWEDEAFYFNSDRQRATEARDAGMAYLFRAIRDLRYRNLRTAVWAHNFHIAEDAAHSFWSNRTMGTPLREAFGNGYVTLALIARTAEIDWIGVGCGPTATAAAGSVEDLLHGLGHDYLLVDLSFPRVQEPFFIPGRTYRLNGTFMVPRQQFDGVIYLDHSRKMDPLTWPSCR
ncbi:MAG TPA: erythromycin esterase family protein [Thermoanaerobaculia bacterium]